MVKFYDEYSSDVFKDHLQSLPLSEFVQSETAQMNRNEIVQVETAQLPAIRMPQGQESDTRWMKADV